ncbi:pteroicidin-alpha-like [Acanthochromis polyacanthus]|uniref:Moronecidin-like n=1 Tax=Acanthochromis polyacanthus TaxID=80966 RepID=A0A3Q1F651_9TELE|nr:pteroicidin-alpha-like [Acanthochromis polyacanthus]
MKCAVVFLVLSMVVLMAEPGECIWGTLIHVGSHLIHGLFHGGKKANLEDQQLEQLDKRSANYNPGQPVFD